MSDSLIVIELESDVPSLLAFVAVANILARNTFPITVQISSVLLKVVPQTIVTKGTQAIRVVRADGVASACIVIAAVVTLDLVVMCFHLFLWLRILLFLKAS